MQENLSATLHLDIYYINQNGSDFFLKKLTFQNIKIKIDITR